MQTIKCRIDHNATDDSDDGIYKRPDELRLRFTLKDGSSKLRKKVTIAARDLRKLAMTESEKVLLSMNAW